VVRIRVLKLSGFLRSGDVVGRSQESCDVEFVVDEAVDVRTDVTQTLERGQFEGVTRHLSKLPVVWHSCRQSSFLMRNMSPKLASSLTRRVRNEVCALRRSSAMDTGSSLVTVIRTWGLGAGWSTGRGVMSVRTSMVRRTSKTVV